MPYGIHDEAVQPGKQPNENFIGYQARVFGNQQGHFANSKNSIFNSNSGELPIKNILSSRVTGIRSQPKQKQNSQGVRGENIPSQNSDYSLYRMHFSMETITLIDGTQVYEGEVHSQRRIIHNQNNNCYEKNKISFILKPP